MPRMSPCGAHGRPRASFADSSEPPHRHAGTSHRIVLLAEAARLVPKGVTCLASALAFQGLADPLPAKVWIAIGSKDWRPRIACPPLRVARFSAEELGRGAERKKIAGTTVPVSGVAKTVADLFRYRRTVGELLAVEGLRQALRQRKATHAQIASESQAAGVWQAMRPYLMALTSDA